MLDARKHFLVVTVRSCVAGGVGSAAPSSTFSSTSSILFSAGLIARIGVFGAHANGLEVTFVLACPFSARLKQPSPIPIIQQHGRRRTGSWYRGSTREATDLADTQFPKSKKVPNKTSTNNKSSTSYSNYYNKNNNNKNNTTQIGQCAKSACWCWCQPETPRGKGKTTVRHRGIRPNPFHPNSTRCTCSIRSPYTSNTSSNSSMQQVGYDHSRSDLTYYHSSSDGPAHTHPSQASPVAFTGNGRTPTILLGCTANTSRVRAPEEQDR